jgi:hypothetical protein
VVGGRKPALPCPAGIVSQTAAMNETTFSLNSRASSDYGAIVIGGGF